MPIFDQGYQHWKGRLSGHGWRWLAVARHGVRAQLKNRIVRLLLLVAWLPAIALVAVLTLWGLLEQQAESVIAFLQRLLPPEVIAQPQRLPLRRLDHRLLVLLQGRTRLLAVPGAGRRPEPRQPRPAVQRPAAVLLAAAAADRLLPRQARRHRLLPGGHGRRARRSARTCSAWRSASTSASSATRTGCCGPASCTGSSSRVSAGTLMLALSSLSRRSIYVGLAWAGFVFLTQMLSGVLIGIRDDTERRQIVREGIDAVGEGEPAAAGRRDARAVPGRSGTRPRPTGDEAAADRRRGEGRRAVARATGPTAYSRAVRPGRGRPARAGPHRLAAGRSPTPTTSTASATGCSTPTRAWVLLGRTVERPRAMLGPLAKQAGGAAACSTRPGQRPAAWPTAWSGSSRGTGRPASLGRRCGCSRCSSCRRRVKSLDRLK